MLGIHPRLPLTLPPSPVDVIITTHSSFGLRGERWTQGVKEEFKERPELRGL